MNDPLGAQRLPIPVGAKYAQRSGRIFRLRSLRTMRFNLYFILALLGVSGAIAGAFVSTSPPVFGVHFTSNGALQIQVGALSSQNVVLLHSLDANGNDVYQSEYGVMVKEETNGQIRTGGSTTLNGQDMTATCIYTVSTSNATCSFTIDGRKLTSVDSKTSSGWSRHYSDGHDVKIDWPNAAFPLPFALGE